MKERGLQNINFNLNYATEKPPKMLIISFLELTNCRWKYALKSYHELQSKEWVNISSLKGNLVSNYKGEHIYTIKTWLATLVVSEVKYRAAKLNADILASMKFTMKLDNWNM